MVATLKSSRSRKALPSGKCRKLNAINTYFAFRCRLRQRNHDIRPCEYATSKFRIRIACSSPWVFKSIRGRISLYEPVPPGVGGCRGEASSGPAPLSVSSCRIRWPGFRLSFGLAAIRGYRFSPLEKGKYCSSGAIGGEEKSHRPMKRKAIKNYLLFGQNFRLSTIENRSRTNQKQSKMVAKDHSNMYHANDNTLTNRLSPWSSRNFSMP